MYKVTKCYWRTTSEDYTKAYFQVTWGPFVENPETFRAHLGWPNSPLHFQNEGASRLETLQLFFIFIPFTTYEKTSFTQ